MPLFSYGGDYSCDTSSQRTTNPARSTTTGKTISSFMPVPLKDGREGEKKHPNTDYRRKD
jgi:hypothetical protein